MPVIAHSEEFEGIQSLKKDGGGFTSSTHIESLGRGRNTFDTINNPGMPMSPLLSETSSNIHLNPVNAERKATPEASKVEWVTALVWSMIESFESGLRNLNPANLSQNYPGSLGAMNHIWIPLKSRIPELFLPTTETIFQVLSGIFMENGHVVNTHFNFNVTDKLWIQLGASNGAYFLKFGYGMNGIMSPGTIPVPPPPVRVRF